MIKKFEEKETENLILSLAKQGLTSEKIGLELKNKCFPTRQVKISEILKKHELYHDADIKNLKESTEKLKKHLSINKQDYKTKRTLLIKEAKLRKLEKIRKEVIKDAKSN